MSLTTVAVLLFLAVAAFIAFAIRREISVPTPAKIRVRLHKMMRRRSLSLPTPPTEAQTRAFSAAIRRCRACNHKALCDEWFATAKAAPTFCPNTTWLATLRDARRSLL
jgi:hypothetical protein